MSPVTTTTQTVLLGIVLLLLTPVFAGAHCDTLDGPVVASAKTALEKRDVTPVLQWVKPQAEAEIREAFKKTLAVRGKGDEAQKLADQYFFETLVRVHRAGEGAGYTGLKPAGTIEPAVAAADKAIETGNADALVHEVTHAVEQGTRTRFKNVLSTAKQSKHSVDAGREYVAAYVEFVHYVEKVHTVAVQGAAPHHEH